MKKRDLQDILNGSEFVAQKRAFRKRLPFAVSRGGRVILVYPDMHTAEATNDRLNQLLNRAN
ncbi:MAG TPA: hypothetical protein VIJ27_11940 [Mucilaginibacter sp.]|jgi:hypothetical protein